MSSVSGSTLGEADMGTCYLDYLRKLLLTQRLGMIPKDTSSYLKGLLQLQRPA